jgi:hypothetical protein
MSDEVKEQATQEQSWDFNTDVSGFPFRVNGQSYEIREMAFGPRQNYLRALGKTMKYKMVGTGKKDDKGKEVMQKEVEILDMNAAQAELLQACVVRVSDDGKATPIKLNEFQGWGSRMIEQIAKKASEINALEMPDSKLQEDAEKN